VPIRCRVVKDLNDFDGSWTFWDSGLLDETSLQIYDALAYHVTHSNNRRLKKVGIWSLQRTAGAALGALKNLADPATAQLRNSLALASLVVSV
jgi:distribution and morphology protein 31